MKIHRNEDGSVSIRLNGQTAVFLRNLPEELRVHLERPDFTKKSDQWLFPRYAEDKATNDELKSLFFEEQRKEKLQRAREFAEKLAHIPARGGEIVLQPAELEHWMGLLTDLRFLYAAAVGIDDDQWREKLRGKKLPRDYALYEHLTELQAVLIRIGFGIEEEPGWYDDRNEG